MKHRKKLGSFSFRAVWGTPAFFFLTAVFLCGAAAGSLTGLRSASAQGALVEQLAAAVIEAGERTQLGTLLRDSLLPALLWPLLVLFCGSFRLHSLFLCAAVAARGFLFSFAVGAMLGLRETAGILLSAVSCAAGGVLTLPCLLLTAAMAFQAALERPARAGGYLYALGRYRGALLVSAGLSMLGGCVRVAAMLLAVRYGLL